MKSIKVVINDGAVGRFSGGFLVDGESDLTKENNFDTILQILKMRKTPTADDSGSCFSSGYWRNDRPWLNDTPWRNG